MPALKDIHETFGGDARFLLAGVSCDEAAEAPAKYTKENALFWTQVARRKDSRSRGRNVSYPDDPSHVSDRS
jgi:hypothetical protein